jgi:hypothetical protein
VVKIPKTGYVGVGRVMEAVQAAKDFTLPTNEGVRPALDVLQHGAEWRALVDDPEKSEYFVRVQWLQTVPRAKPSTRWASSAIRTRCVGPPRLDGGIR